MDIKLKIIIFCKERFKNNRYTVLKKIILIGIVKIDNEESENNGAESMGSIFKALYGARTQILLKRPYFLDLKGQK